MAIFQLAFAGNKTLAHSSNAKPVPIQFQQAELNGPVHKKNIKVHCYEVCCKKLLRTKQNKLVVLKKIKQLRSS
jgi:hypothetical protein